MLAVRQDDDDDPGQKYKLANLKDIHLVYFFI